MTTTLTKEEWVKRAEAQYLASGADKDAAAAMAEAIYDTYAEDSTPEDAADEDMSYWGD